MDMSIHAHLLVDVAMQERDYHDALVLRRYLETFNRIDNHWLKLNFLGLMLISPLWMAIMNTWSKGIENHWIMVSESAEKRIPFVSDEASSLKDEETTAEQASLFIEFLTLNGLDSMSTSASKSSPLNIAIFAFIRYWRRKGILAPQHIVSANAIYRFLTDDCHIRKEVTIKSFYNVFNHCEDMKNQEMDDKVADFFAHR